MLIGLLDYWMVGYVADGLDEAGTEPFPWMDGCCFGNTMHCWLNNNIIFT
jgi:hypothetical protein